MGSIKTKGQNTAAAFFAGLLVFFVSPCPAGAQEVSLSAEISRLEKITLAPGASGEKYGAFSALIKLYRISGDTENALKTCGGALVLFPGDGSFLLEQGRLFASRGEYEKASASAGALLANGRARELFPEGRYLAAQIEAFGTGNTGALVSLAAEPGSVEFRSGIYYTLWKLKADALWKNRLLSEFPRSPEAKIAAAAPGVEAAPTPLWLLFSGRNGVSLAAAARSPVRETAFSPAAGPERKFGFLQTGLFGSEENARAMGERLRKAGFESRISRRVVNGGDYWAVSVDGGVDGGVDINNTLLRLKDAGFEAFPVENP